MSFLFEVENNLAKPTTETLLTEPYRSIWNRDQSKDKIHAIREFTYIEFMISKKKTNPFGGYEPSVRKLELKKLLFQDNPEWEEDELVNQGMEKLHEFQTNGSASYSFYLAAEVAANKLKNFFLTFDINERNTRTGMPIFTPKSISSSINDAEQNIRTLQSVREKVEQELLDAVKTRNNRQINPFEV